MAGMMPSAGTFAEEILTVQAARGKTVTPAAGVISIPYTRADVLVDNGVAKQRYLQVLHNHSATNQGFAFTLPLAPDTTITHFNLWDQGQRYVGAIEERVRAEDVYKEVTGDEAPELRRDPGLVRQTGNVYEMRVFPIQPGEDKQVELFSHRRLGMEAGQFVLNLPLAQMTQPRDPRHGVVISAVTEVSVLLRDELPITAVQVDGGEFQEERLDDHQRLLRLRRDTQVPADLKIRYTVAVPTGGAITPWTVNVDNEQYFLLRVLQPAQPVAATNEPGRRFYMAVWKPIRPEAAASINNDELAAMRDMALEMTAFLTLRVLNPNDTFQGAYRSSPTGIGREMLPSAATTNFYRVADFEKAFGEAFGLAKRAANKSAAPTPDVVKHLTDALDDRDCRFIYLFLGGLTDPETRTLAQLVEQHRDRDFILVTEAAHLPAALQDQTNVSHFSLHNGWTAIRHKLAKARTVLPEAEAGFDDLFTGMGTPLNSLTKFWEKLPNLGRQLSSLQTKGAVQLRDVQIFQGGLSAFFARPGQTASPGKLGVVWLSGRYDGTGDVEFDLELPDRMDLFGRGNQHPQTSRLTGRATLQTRDGGERWVGALHVRQVAEMLGAEMRLLRVQPRGRRQMVNTDPAAREARLAELRREVVRLSRTFGFISSETAFIALPPELLRKYGLTPQEMTAQQSYNANPARIVPEPAVWQLAVIGLLLLTIISWVRRQWQRTTGPSE